MYRAELENDNAVCCPFQGLSAIKRFKPLLWICLFSRPPLLLPWCTRKNSNAHYFSFFKSFFFLNNTFMKITTSIPSSNNWKWISDQV
jgi:hypothetical protein